MRWRIGRRFCWNKRRGKRRRESRGESWRYRRRKRRRKRRSDGRRIRRRLGRHEGRKRRRREGRKGCRHRRVVDGTAFHTVALFPFTVRRHRVAHRHATLCHTQLFIAGRCRVNPGYRRQKAPVDFELLAFHDFHHKRRILSVRAIRAVCAGAGQTPRVLPCRRACAVAPAPRSLVNAPPDPERRHREELDIVIAPPLRISCPHPKFVRRRPARHFELENAP